MRTTARSQQVRGVARVPEHVSLADRIARAARVGLTVVWLLATETVVIGLAALPVLLAWRWLLDRGDMPVLLRTLLLALVIAPGAILFGVLLLALSALAARVMHWRTPRDTVLVIARLEWPLLRWVCYSSCNHVAGLLAGSWLRASPPWSWYLRANGARVGRGVYVNTVKMTDHNLLEFADGSVIGSDVHLSGHTVERGRVITGAVRIGAGAVVGIQSVVGIDVEIGDGVQVGALSLVPKHSRLASGGTFGGIPVRRLDTR